MKWRAPILTASLLITLVCVSGCADLLFGSLTCVNGTTNCDGTCLDLMGNTDNCGLCGKKCDTGYYCRQGTCVLQPVISCPFGVKTCQLTSGSDGSCCSRRCVDIKNDEGNCGSCGHQCDNGWTCSNGVCVISLVKPQTKEKTSVKNTVCNTVNISKPKEKEVYKPGAVLVVEWDWQAFNREGYNMVNIDLYKENQTVPVIQIGTNILNTGSFFYTIPLTKSGSIPTREETIMTNLGRGYARVTTPDGKCSGKSSVFIISGENKPAPIVLEDITPIPVYEEITLYQT